MVMRPVSGAALAALFLFLAVTPAKAGNITGKAAPAWELECLCGETLSSGDLAGRPVLMDFGSIFCADCQDMAWHLADMEEVYGSRGLQVVFVNVDGIVFKGAVQGFMKGVGGGYRTVFDEDYLISKAFGVDTIPHLVLIDAEGKVRASGYAGKGRVIPETTIEKILTEAEGPALRR